MYRMTYLSNSINIEVSKSRVCESGRCSGQSEKQRLGLHDDCKRVLKFPNDLWAERSCEGVWHRKEESLGLEYKLAKE